MQKIPANVQVATIVKSFAVIAPDTRQEIAEFLFDMMEKIIRNHKDDAVSAVAQSLISDMERAADMGSDDSDIFGSGSVISTVWCFVRDNGFPDFDTFDY